MNRRQEESKGLLASLCRSAKEKNKRSAVKKLFTIALAATALLAGCDKIKDAASKDFTVNGVKFEFNATVEGGGTRAGEGGSFSVTRTVSLSEIGSSELAEYKNMIDKVKANSSKLRV